MLSVKNVLIWWILMVFVPLLVTTENDSSSSEEVLIISEAKARELLDEISPKINSDLKWKFELKLRNPATMSLVEETGTILDEIEFRNRIDGYKKELTPYRNVIENDWDLKRQFDLMMEFSCGENGEELMDVIEEILEEFGSIQDEITFCVFKNKTDCQRTYNGFLRDKISSISDESELKYYWDEWRTKAGAIVRRKYERLVKDYRKLAVCNGVNSTQMYLHPFEDGSIMNDISSAIEDLAPLYNQVHAFIRHTLNMKYNLTHEAQDLIRIDLLEKFLLEKNIEHLSPYVPQISIPDSIEAEMIAQNYTALKFLHQADDFFTSMNMTKQTKFFWKFYVQRKPSDCSCKPEAIALPGRGDAGLKYCPNLNLNNFILSHYEMARLQYYENMKDLPVPYRIGLWPGFVEAVATAVSLSASTRSYLEKVGLVSNGTVDQEQDMRSLLDQAVNVIFSLKINYVREKFRLDVLEGKVESDSYNTHFWNLMDVSVGSKPPTNRSIYDFDAAIYLQDLKPDGITEIVRITLGYQLYEGLCKTNRSSTDSLLNMCNFSGSMQAGSALKEAMALGASKPWRDVLESISGNRKITTSAILNYFEPLTKWLELENKKNNETVGWRNSTSI